MELVVDVQCRVRHINLVVERLETLRTISLDEDGGAVELVGDILAADEYLNVRLRIAAVDMASELSDVAFRKGGVLVVVEVNRSRAVWLDHRPPDFLHRNYNLNSRRFKKQKSHWITNLING